MSASGSWPISAGLDAHRLEQGAAHRRLVGALVLEQEVVVHVEQPRGVFGPLDVAADPVERLRDPAQHARRPRPQRSLLLLLLLLPSCMGSGPSAGAVVGAIGAPPGAERSGRVLPASVRVGEHPRVLRPAALAGVHDQAALRERDARQATGHHPDVAAVVHRERPEVEVARPHPAVDERRRGRERDRLLRDPAARVGADTWRGARRASLRWRAARSRARSRRSRRRACRPVGRRARRPTRTRRDRRAGTSRRWRGSAPRRGSTRSSRARTGRRPCRRPRRCPARSRS